MASLRGNDGNWHGCNHPSDGSDHPCYWSTDLLHCCLIRLLLSFQLHSTSANGPRLCRIRNSSRLSRRSVADQQEPGYVWKPIGDLDTFCVDICFESGHWIGSSIIKETLICMSYSVFADKQTRPTSDEVRQALGSVWQEWTSLLEFLSSHFRPQEDFRFLYGNNYGWAVRFREKGKLLTALFPNRDHFIALVILNTKQLDCAKRLKFGSGTREAIGSANLYSEGKWLFVPVSGSSDVEDVQTLLELKAQKAGVGVQSTKKRSG